MLHIATLKIYVACSFNHGHQQRAQLQYNCKALEPVIVGMVLNSKQ